MTNQDVLDLSEIDPPIWQIMVKQVVYGPYTLGQMRSFVLENRLTLKSSTAEGDGAAFLPAGEQPRLSAIFQEHLASQPVEQTGPAANHLIVAGTRGDNRSQVIAVLNRLGRFAEIMPGTYLLNTTTRTADLRQQLEVACADDAKVVIVNADTGRLAWLGLGSETDTHIRTIWTPKA